MPCFQHDTLTFYYQETGKGIPFFFQHGLGGDVNQPFDLFSPPTGIRLISLDFRAHGKTPVGPDEKITLSTFADDVVALMDYLEIPQAIIGGISMGAAVALNVALRYPGRMQGLILSRPAWLDGTFPESNKQLFSQIAELIRQYGAAHAAEQFQQTERYTEILRQSPDTANSLLRQFAHPRAEETVIKLERLPNDAPCHDRGPWQHITVPTLVLANKQDPIHPFAYGEIFAEAIPSSEFQELTPKSVNPEQHATEVQRFIEDFLKTHFLT